MTASPTSKSLDVVSVFGVDTAATTVYQSLDILRVKQIEGPSACWSADIRHGDRTDRYPPWAWRPTVVLPVASDRQDLQRVVTYVGYLDCPVSELKRALGVL